MIEMQTAGGGLTGFIIPEGQFERLRKVSLQLAGIQLADRHRARAGGSRRISQGDSANCHGAVEGRSPVYNASYAYKRPVEGEGVRIQAGPDGCERPGDAESRNQRAMYAMTISTRMFISGMRRPQRRKP